MCGIQQGYAKLETRAWQTRACKSSNLTTGRCDIFITAFPITLCSIHIPSLPCLSLQDATPSSQLSRESSPSTSPQHSSSISSSSSSSASFGVLSEDLFAETVIPHLCKIVLVRDHDIFLTLLRFLPQYLHLIPKDKLEETFLPQMLLGLQVGFLLYLSLSRMSDSPVAVALVFFVSVFFPFTGLEVAARDWLSGK